MSDTNKHYLIQDRASAENVFEGSFEQFCDSFGGVQDEATMIAVCVAEDWQCFVEVTGLRPNPMAFKGAVLVCGTCTMGNDGGQAHATWCPGSAGDS